MTIEQLFVIEWQDTPYTWEPMLEVFYTVKDARRRKKALTQAHGNKKNLFRIRPYGRIRG